MCHRRELRMDLKHLVLMAVYALFEFAIGKSKTIRPNSLIELSLAIGKILFNLLKKRFIAGGA